MKGDELRGRTKRFALEIIRLSSELPREQVAYVLGNQLLRAGTSVGAHCAEAYRSRSDAEFISKLETALQELEETLYWLDLLKEANCASAERLEPLTKETDELLAILVTSVKNVKSHRK